MSFVVDRAQPQRIRIVDSDSDSNFLAIQCERIEFYTFALGWLCYGFQIARFIFWTVVRCGSLENEIFPKWRKQFIA